MGLEQPDNPLLDAGYCFQPSTTIPPPPKSQTPLAALRAAVMEAIGGLRTARQFSRAVWLSGAWDAYESSVDAEPRSGDEVHVLKTDSRAFQLVWDGLKNYEVRKFDRSYRVGDEVVLVEQMGEGGGPLSGRSIRGTIVSIVAPGSYGLGPEVGVFGFRIEEKGT